MSRLSVAALVLAFAAFAIGIVGPLLDPGVLREQLAFAERTADRPVAEPEKQGLRAEAERWLTRKIRERNDAAEETQQARPPETGLFGAAAPHVLTAQFILALAGLALAIADWLRSRAVRPNVMAGALALSALALPFVWSAVAIAVTIAVCFMVLALLGNILG